MHIAWDSFVVVSVVSFAAAVAVVVLVSFALVALSGRPGAAVGEPGQVATATRSGQAIAGVCLAAAALIVLYGLYIIVA
jgi:hypothetical protein